MKKQHVVPQMNIWPSDFGPNRQQQRTLETIELPISVFLVIGLVTLMAFIVCFFALVIALCR